RESQCVFPSCTRKARSADVDHIVPYEEGGPTCGCNLAPLCRRHHRAKTHANWTHVMVTPGTYLWTSPTAQQYLVDGRGTFHIPALGQWCAHTQQRDRALPPKPPSHSSPTHADPGHPNPGATIPARPSPGNPSPGNQGGSAPGPPPVERVSPGPHR